MKQSNSEKIPKAIMNRAVKIFQYAIPDETKEAIFDFLSKNRTSKELLEFEMTYGVGIKNILRNEWLTDDLLPSQNWDDCYMDCLKAALGFAAYDKQEYDHYRCQCEDKIFPYLFAKMYITNKDGTRESGKISAEICAENEDVLDEFLKPWRFNTWRLSANINEFPNTNEAWPWAVVLFNGEFNLAGHISSIRTSIEFTSFNYYSMPQPYSLEIYGPPKVSAVYIRSKKELSKLASKSPLFVPAWEHLAGLSVENGMGRVYISDSPDTEWIKSNEREDEKLFWAIRNGENQ
ncbi:MAG: hypothetical protein EOM59_00900 [Clostridia bacterium]|nr:hypothetical protein [Clostridia bacterium]